MDEDSSSPGTSQRESESHDDITTQSAANPTGGQIQETGGCGPTNDGNNGDGDRKEDTPGQETETNKIKETGGFGYANDGNNGDEDTHEQKTETNTTEAVNIKGDENGKGTESPETSVNDVGGVDNGDDVDGRHDGGTGVKGSSGIRVNDEGKSYDTVDESDDKETVKSVGNPSGEDVSDEGKAGDNVDESHEEETFKSDEDSRNSNHSAVKTDNTRNAQTVATNEISDSIPPDTSYEAKKFEQEIKQLQVANNDLKRQETQLKDSLEEQKAKTEKLEAGRILMETKLQESNQENQKQQSKIQEMEAANKAQETQLKDSLEEQKAKTEKLEAGRILMETKLQESNQENQKQQSKIQEMEAANKAQETQLKDSLEEQKAKTEKLEAGRILMETKLQESNQENQKQQSKIQEMEAANKAMETKLQESHQENQKQQSKIKELEVANKTIETELHDVQNENKNQRQKNKTLNEENERLKGEQATLKVQVVQLDESLRTLEDERREERKLYNTEKKDLENRLAKEIVQASDDVMALNKSNSVIQKRYESAKDTFNSTISKRDSKIKAQQDAGEVLKKELKTIKNHNADFQKTIKTLEKERSTILASLQAVSVEYDSTKRNLLATNTELKHHGKEIDDLKWENNLLANKILEADQTISYLGQDNSQLHSKLAKAKSSLETSKTKARGLLTEKHELEKEKAELLTRISRMASANLTYNNPQIADLSDNTRPTKLAEMVSELYDNQWTDAFEECECPTDEDNIRILYCLLRRAYELCEETCMGQLNAVKESLSTLKFVTRLPGVKDEKVSNARAQNSSYNTERIEKGEYDGRIDESCTNHEESVHGDVNSVDKEKLSDEVQPTCFIVRTNEEVNNAGANASEDRSINSGSRNSSFDDVGEDENKIFNPSHSRDCQEIASGSIVTSDVSKSAEYTSAIGDFKRTVANKDETVDVNKTTNDKGESSDVNSTTHDKDANVDLKSKTDETGKTINVYSVTDDEGANGYVKPTTNDGGETVDTKPSNDDKGENVPTDPVGNGKGVIDDVKAIPDNSGKSTVNIPTLKEQTFSWNFDDFSTSHKKSLLEMRMQVLVNFEKQVNEAITEAIVQELDLSTREKVKTYVKECVHLCWKMFEKSPPVHIKFSNEDQDFENPPFQTESYKFYTRSGTIIDYVVWPPLYLHKDGPLLCKGIAQARQARVTLNK